MVRHTRLTFLPWTFAELDVGTVFYSCWSDGPWIKINAEWACASDKPGISKPFDGDERVIPIIKQDPANKEIE